MFIRVQHYVPVDELKAIVYNRLCFLVFNDLQLNYR